MEGERKEEEVESNRIELNDSNETFTPPRDCACVCGEKRVEKVRKCFGFLLHGALCGQYPTANLRWEKVLVMLKVWVTWGFAMSACYE